MGKKKKKEIEEEIDEFSLDKTDYDEYHEDELEEMINDIINGDPDDKITVDNLHLMFEWIKRKI